MNKHGINDNPQYGVDNTYLKRVETHRTGKQVHIWGVKQREPKVDKIYNHKIYHESELQVAK